MLWWMFLGSVMGVLMIGVMHNTRDDSVVLVILRGNCVGG